MRNNQQILMASSVHTWSDARIYSKEAKSLANNGKQVTFIAIDSDVPKETISNLRMIYLPKKNRLLRFMNWFKIYAEMKNSENKFFHFHDPELLIVALALRVKHKNKITIIYDMHEHLPSAIRTKDWIPKRWRKSLSFLIEKTEKLLIRSCDCILFAEESYKKEYTDCRLVKEDIYNFPIAATSIQKDPAILEKETIDLIYAGALTEQRGLFNMLQLMALIHEQEGNKYHLHLVGDMNTDKERVQQFINEHKLIEIVHIYERKKYEDLWSLYSYADIGLCLLHPTPNNVNSKSTKLFEYMAASLPIIASDFPIYQFIEENHCGYTGDINDAAVLYQKIKAVAEEDNLKEELAANGRKLYENTYSWKNEEKKLLNLYKKLEEKSYEL
jgi:glycosyltransferase involved in cell wall biosynthesis